jgi:CRISPR-associated protein Csb2
MSRVVLITVRFHDGRCHGTGDGPPSPARLFQALVAGGGLGGPKVLKEFESPLKWVEEREPPIIASPVVVDGQSFKTYVPNNDLDAMGGDARRIGKIREDKTIRPRTFDESIPYLYAWTFDEDEESERQAQAICALAEKLYQFGRGVDMAWAFGELLTVEELDARLSNYPGLVARPSHGGTGRTLACPIPGSLQSLNDRYAAGSRRFKTEVRGNAERQLFSQPPKPRFKQVAFDSPPTRCLFDLRDDIAGEISFGVWPLARTCKLVEWLRNRAADRLRQALSGKSSEIERFLIGRKADGTDGAPTALRIRIVPLPSIGHPHADHGIRRVLVEVPAGCPLRADDVRWAFSGLEIGDPETGEIVNLILTPSSDESMLVYYGATERAHSRIWRTVTPIALPDSTSRRRIEPTRMLAEAKAGAERAIEQARAAGAVVQALRHAEVRTRTDGIRVQREPFEGNGERVEVFAPGTRFAKERLWHVEITFNAPVSGPLLIGDGRFLGLGVMRPVRQVQGVHAFVVEGGLSPAPEPTEVTRALRRAVMSRVQELIGRRAVLPGFFSGHERDGSPALTERSPHLTFVFDPIPARLLIVAPHVIDRRTPTAEEVQHLRNLDAALTEFRELRAGSSGRLMLGASSIDSATDPLFAASRNWRSVTSYQVTRHAKRAGAEQALVTDIHLECRRHGHPKPQVTAKDLNGLPGVGLVAKVFLTFEVSVEGPMILGRSRHLGGGLFTAARSGVDST